MEACDDALKTHETLRMYALYAAEDQGLTSATFTPRERRIPSDIINWMGWKMGEDSL